VDEEELKAYVDEVAEAIPAKYRTELEKLMEVRPGLFAHIDSVGPGCFMSQS